MSLPRPLIVMALEMESQGLIEAAGYEICYTGVGKVNATYVLMKHLAQRKAPPTLVLNFGSAGSSRFRHDALVAAHRFVQRDMDVSGLGFALGETPFDSIPAAIEFDPLFTELPHGVCGSGDSFLQGPSPVPCDIADMEAYALAKVCKKESVPFACIKYITDGTDGTAHTDWQENVHKGAELFVALLAKSR